jgi:hypothetical protein
MFTGRPLEWLDIVVVACCFAGVAFGVLTLLNEPGLRRGRFRFFCAVLLGSVFVIGASDVLATRAVAPRLTVTGNIVTLRNRGGRNQTCDIGLADFEGGGFGVRGDFSCGDLYVGERIKATWLIFNAHIVRVDIESGVNAGRHLNDTAPFTSVVGILFGLSFIYLAVRSRRSNPHAYPRKRTRGDPPSSGVDEDSLLNANGRE